MSQRVSMITLGVDDLKAATEFYSAWGWTPAADEGSIVFYQLNGLVLALFPRADLAKDIGTQSLTPGSGSVTLAQNFPTREDVDRVFQAGLDAGATALKQPTATDWGGYSGYLADPDGHTWELAVNPFWELANNGAVTIENPQTTEVDHGQDSAELDAEPQAAAGGMRSARERQGDLPGVLVPMNSWEEWWEALEPFRRAGYDTSSFPPPIESSSWGPRPAHMIPD